MRRVRYTNTITLTILVIGLLIVLLGAFYAFYAYKNYEPILPRGNTLEEAITNSTYDLVNLAAQLAFLGLGIWAGAVLVREGLKHLHSPGCTECSAQQKSGSQ